MLYILDVRLYNKYLQNKGKQNPCLRVYEFINLNKLKMYKLTLNY